MRAFSCRGDKVFGIHAIQWKLLEYEIQHETNIRWVSTTVLSTNLFLVDWKVVKFSIQLADGWKNEIKKKLGSSLFDDKCT